MPMYAYHHEACGWNAVLRRTVDTLALSACPACHEITELRPLITREHHARTIMPSVTNQLYNNGQGRYDEGLGRVIHSRSEHKRIMMQQGVTDVNISEDDFMDTMNREPPAAELQMEDVKDAWAHEEAEYNKGKRPAEGGELPDNVKIINEGE